MEETLGKRIVFHRKRLGLTQDALAELMGVTAQAVSKWENDQSCPDIGALPKLAEIFGISTDELLGVERKEVHPAEIVPTDGEENGVHSHPEMTWELSVDDEKKGGIGLAIWILLVGGIMLTSYLLNFHAKLWDVVWPSALLVFGIFGLFPRFSFFRLGCSLFGLYFLMSNLNFAPFRLGRGVSSAGSSAAVRRQSAGGHSSQVEKRHAQQRLLFLPPHQKRRPQKRALHLHRQFL